MKQAIRDGTFVELSYRLIDRKTGDILTSVEFPLGYVHGHSSVLDPRVMAQLEGRVAGETLSVMLDGDDLYGARDESLVITDLIENVPEEYRAVGTQILMENEQGETRTFFVTRINDKTLTIDGNHPLCGRQLIFELDVLSVREATEAEIAAGGPLEQGPDLGWAPTRPI
ncbi:MAG: FKBP-type peptidyl-prolyl cis-trans isomerase [Thermochromatium sp.]